MVRMHATQPALQLDPKRIVATSAVLALHLAAAMALMAPIAVPPEPALTDAPALEIVPTYVPPLPPIDEHPIKRSTAHPTTAAVPVRTPTATAPVEAAAPPSDQGTLPATDAGIDPPTFDPGPPAAAALQTDVAPAPPYPAMALRRGIEGEVLLRVLVDPLGNPIEVSIERSSGSRLLDDGALKFVKARWHFVAATQSGVAISAYALVPISFRIE